MLAPEPSCSSPTNPAYCARLSRHIRASGDAPVISPPGASIPAPAQLASAAISRASNTVTDTPRCASRHAQLRPIIPPPTTIMILNRQTPDYKPVFVPLRAIAIRLGRTLLH